MRSARLLEMALAMSMGDVSHAMPSRMEPSGIVIKMGSRGCAIRKYQVLLHESILFDWQHHPYLQHHTCINLVGLLFELIKHGNAMSYILGRRRDLGKEPIRQKIYVSKWEVQFGVRGFDFYLEWVGRSLGDFLDFGLALDWLA